MCITVHGYTEKSSIEGIVHCHGTKPHAHCSEMLDRTAHYVFGIRHILQFHIDDLCLRFAKLAFLISV